MAKASKIIAVYEIRNTVSGTFYIGSSANLYERWRTHRKKLRSNTHHNPRLQASWRKHGEDAFVFLKLAECEDVVDMCIIEEALISSNISNPLCCNISLWQDTPMRGRSGEAHPNYGKPISDEQKAALSKATKRQWETSDPRTGCKHTEETKAKISAKVQEALAEGRGGKFIPSEETRKKMSDALKGNQNAKGHVRTEEHRRKLSEANRGNKNFLGKTHSPETKAKMGRAIIARSPDGAETAYVTITELRLDLGMTSPTVNRALKSGKPLSKGRMSGWSFAYA